MPKSSDTHISPDGCPLALGQSSIDANLADGNGVATGDGLPAGATILMVDDEKLNSYVVAQYLKAAGYRALVQTTDPIEALSLATRLRPDAILLDIEMPRMNGLEVLRRIGADPTLATIPVVIISAADDEAVEAQARKLGASGFLHKPICKDDLLALLQNILAQPT
jgi:CheY-like chemotaxis protein